MRLIRGRYRSRKSYKRATGNALRGSGRYYNREVRSDGAGNRFINIVDKLGRKAKYLLSAGPLR